MSDDDVQSILEFQAGLLRREDTSASLRPLADFLISLDIYHRAQVHGDVGRMNDLRRAASYLQSVADNIEHYARTAP